MRYTETGFTLTEALVAMVILGILTAIAYPNYVDYVNKSKTATGQQAIAATMATLEQSYLDCRMYPPDSTCTPPTDAPAMTDSGSYFTYTYTQAGTPTGQTFYITASGNGALAKYFIASNSNDVRCVCLNCAGNPFSGFNDTTTACPSGTAAW